MPVSNRRLVVIAALLLAGCTGASNPPAGPAPTADGTITAPSPTPTVVVTASPTPTPAASAATVPASAPPATPAPSPTPLRFSSPPATSARVSRDRPDDRMGPQIHFIYAVPAGTADEALDLTGAIGRSVEGINFWLRTRAGGRVLKVDTYQGMVDVTYLTLPGTDAENQKATGGPLARIRVAAVEAGLLSNEKVYAAFYAGQGAPGAERPVGDATTNFAAAYLKGATDLRMTGVLQGPTWEAVMLHELIHALGFMGPDGRPRHVTDSTNDLMAMQQTRVEDPFLDLNRDDYFNHDKPNTLDLADSPYMELYDASKGP